MITLEMKTAVRKAQLIKCKERTSAEIMNTDEGLLTTNQQFVIM